MNLPGKWRPRLWRRKLPAAAVGEAPFEGAAASGLHDLQTRLNHWSHLWNQQNESAARTEAQQVVAERLARWMERCFGQHVQSSLRAKGSQISLASSTPMFTAFLGRRATRELSRRVLQDI
ncbi:MAG: hypothetical protein P4L26_10590 [Terracidiphilus sp.]|nr:hypothetical protein [Terracidiphilus sp.]